MIDAIASLSGGPAGAAPVSGVAASRAAGPAATIAPTADFGSVLASVASDAMRTMGAGEAAAISGLQGQSSVQNVVQAVMSAEQTLQTALAVRDKVVAAYQEISRMAI